MKRTLATCCVVLAFFLAGCQTIWKAPAPSAAELTPRQLAIVEQLDLDPEEIAYLEAKPLYEFSEGEVGRYLAFVAQDEPDLAARVIRLGRKNIGQPYELHLLGEFPFETYDPLPLYCLDRSDCVVFAEHTYAMALTEDWPSFFAMLQRIRYKEGRIGVVTRNHYTEADWTVNNRWLVREITSEIGGERVATYDQAVNRSRFLKNRYGVERDIPVERITVSYIPVEHIPEIEPHLRDGDMVHVVVGPNPQAAYVSHVGLVAIGDDGTVNFLHSTPPRVVEEPLSGYSERRLARKEQLMEEGKAYLIGYRFLRLNPDPITELRMVDGPEAPRVSVTEGQRFLSGRSGE